jgi:hypothetical protein
MVHTMNGAHHYREYERILNVLKQQLEERNPGTTFENVSINLQLAHIHAALAQAAATYETHPQPGYDDWRKALQ